MPRRILERVLWVVGGLLASVALFFVAEAIDLWRVRASMSADELAEVMDVCRHPHMDCFVTPAEPLHLALHAGLFALVPLLLAWWLRSRRGCSERAKPTRARPGQRPHAIR